jgi:hypothetical protein
VQAWYLLGSTRTVSKELQNRVHQFNSGRGLHQYNQRVVLIT